MPIFDVMIIDDYLDVVRKIRTQFYSLAVLSILFNLIQLIALLGEAHSPA